MKFGIPVAYRSSSDRKKPVRIDTVVVDVAEVRPQDAPVAISLPDSYGGNGEFRLHEGRLWHKLSDRTIHEAKSVYRLDNKDAENPNPYMKRAMGDPYHYQFRNNHPLRPSRRLDIGFWHNCPTAWDESPSDHPDMVMMRQRISELASRTIMINGEFWRDSPGPLISFERREDRVRWIHPTEEASAFYARVSWFRADRAEEGLDIINTALGERLAVGNRAPIINIPGHITFDDEASAADAAASLAIWELRRCPRTDLSRDAVAALVSIRKMWAERWPDVDIDVNPGKFDEAWPLERDVVSLPPAGDLSGPIRDLVREVLPDIHPWLKKQFKIMAERIDRQFKFEAEADAEAMATFTL